MTIWRLGLAGALAALGLGACATCPPAPASPPAPPPVAAAQPPRPRVPPPPPARPVKCVPDDLGPPPTYPDSETALRDAGGAADRYQLLAAGRILRDARLQKLEEAVRRCRNTGR